MPIPTELQEHAIVLSRVLPERKDSKGFNLVLLIIAILTP